mmetsp:Transcript_68254/g.193346  ORF Transcript_68254/g.193346 Transcript_68254/m.193346 type:complete len:224 (+) Transcript_68254:709-1380(+)
MPAKADMASAVMAPSALCRERPKSWTRKSWMYTMITPQGMLPGNACRITSMFVLFCSKARRCRVVKLGVVRMPAQWHSDIVSKLPSWPPLTGSSATNHNAALAAADGIAMTKKGHRQSTEPASVAMHCPAKTPAPLAAVTNAVALARRLAGNQSPTREYTTGNEPPIPKPAAALARTSSPKVWTLVVSMQETLVMNARAASRPRRSTRPASGPASTAPRTPGK